MTTMQLLAQQAVAVVALPHHLCQISTTPRNTNKWSLSGSLLGIVCIGPARPPKPSAYPSHRRLPAPPRRHHCTALAAPTQASLIEASLRPTPTHHGQFNLDPAAGSRPRRRFNRPRQSLGHRHNVNRTVAPREQRGYPLVTPVEDQPPRDLAPRRNTVSDDNAPLSRTCATLVSSDLFTPTLAPATTGSSTRPQTDAYAASASDKLQLSEVRKNHPACLLSQKTGRQPIVLGYGADAVLGV